MDMQDRRIQIMREYSVLKAIITMAIPAIMGLVVMGLYNLVDTMFVSWLGKEATGAAQVVFPITMILSSIGLALGIGGGSLISRLLGQNNQEKANQVCSINFFLSMAMGIIATILSILFLDPLLTIFGATGKVMIYAQKYGFYIMLGGFATVMNMTLNNLLRAEGSAKHSMIAMIIGSVLNIILDPLLIFTFDMGIQGAAIATTFSQIVTFAILISYYINKKSLVELHVKNIQLEQGILGEILKIGAPTFARQLLVSISLAFLNNSAVFYGGDTALAAIGIVSKMVTMIMFFIFGLSQGFQPVAGFNYGARRYDRVLEAVGITIKIGLTFSILSMIISILLTGPLLSLFRPEAAVEEIARVFIKYALVSLIFMSFSNVISVLYQALGKAGAALILSISRQGLFFIPIIILLPRMIGLQGVMMAQTLADAGTLILSVVIFVPTFKRLRRYIMKAEGRKAEHEKDC